MREIRQSGSEGGGTKPIASPYPYREKSFKLRLYLKLRRTFFPLRVSVRSRCLCGEMTET